MKILISSCLMGDNVKYSGGNNFNKDLVKLLKENNLEIIKICPEVLGGLSIPRIPAEIIENKVINKIGEDVTKEFENGAEKVLEIARKNKLDLIILKENSPSCGVNNIYDGTFSNILISGQGLTTKKLLKEDIKIFSEKNLDEIKKFIKKGELKNEYSFT